MRKGFLKSWNAPSEKCSADPYWGWCPNWSVQRVQRPEQRTTRWKLTFLWDSGLWETDDRQIEGDRELRESLTTEAACGNLRNRKRDRLSKHGGFRTTGDGYVCPRYRYNLALSPPHPSAAVWRSLLIGEGTIRKDRGKWQGSENKQREEESLVCLENVNTALVAEKCNPNVLCYSEQL